MLRRLIPLLLTLSLSVFAQYGGIVLPGGIRVPVPGTNTGGQYPGGQYPGGQNPGGQYPVGQSPNARPGSGELMTGYLRRISYTSLTIETDDERIVTMQIQQNARLYANMGNAQISDFDPGDYVSLNALQNMNGYYFANTITLERKGTPQDRADASQPTTIPMHSGNNQDAQSQSDSSDGNRPVLRRADTSSSSSAGAGSTDDGRPVLRRADSPASADSQAASPAASGSSDSGSATAGSSGAASSGSGSPAPVQPQITQPDDSMQSASISPVGDSRMAGDPGPPVLRRGAPARDQNAPDETATGSLPPRPSVRSAEVNGVTQLPAALPPVTAEAVRSNPSPDQSSEQPSEYGASTGDPIIDHAREVAFEFTDTLPDYIVKQFTTRYQSESASRGDTSWQALDIVTADVVAEDGKETYKNLMVNGKPTKDVDKTGSWSEGEFASTLQAVLSPVSDALFTNKRSTTIANRPAYRYDYSIAQPQSNWRVYVGGETYRPAYGGGIWIDKETSRVLRIEMVGRNIPDTFGLDTVESTVDYDFVLIGDKKFLLPVHSEALSCMRGTTECTKNAIDFRNYRKYSSDTSITFEETVK